ncbi:T9SS type A sorting domain-containing protein [Flavobacterium azooxidireducens]|uniref:T9SS type A sorting domain-containing protein n=1 Tax=Flavobacterium azooxidireducens TaxID=1871076 RepID=A0ABY4KI99_9FLAO|nr:T9SS type A sorting domain-containing protein [Flavobacterium azooxidireducens]UPQ79135.1 T9SS type A sorting domain-containing protein [Flavobacterium azooxidireducens]
MRKITLFVSIFSFFLLKAQTAPTASLTIEQPYNVCDYNTECQTLTANYTELYSTSEYEVSSIPYYFVDQSSLINSYNLLDDKYKTLNLPFDFTFFGNTYSAISIGANGLITFNEVEIDEDCPWQFQTTIPNTNFPIKNAIYGVYQDLNPQISNPETNDYPNLTFKMIGSYPNRKAVYTFYEMGFYVCQYQNQGQTSQIVLHETTNIIDVNIVRRVPCTNWNSGNGLIGIQNIAGNLGFSPPNRNTGSWSAFDESWRFTPSGESITELVWYKNGEFLTNENPMIDCDLNENSPSDTYTATIIYNHSPDNISEITTSQNSTVIPMPVIPEPENIVLCNQNDGFYTVDLTINEFIISNLNPLAFQISYHLSFDEAVNLAYQIQNPSSYVFFNSNQTIYMAIEDYVSGCIYVKPFEISAMPNIAPPNGEPVQSFTEGQTLDDLIVVGENINWYDEPEGGNLLPSTTLLENNTTYYASQTVNGCESRMSTTQRFAILAISSLNLTNFDTNSFQISPNPFLNNVTIINNNTNVNLEVYSVLGQKITSFELINGNNTVNLNNLNSGVYFFKISTDNKSQTFKMIKK